MTFIDAKSAARAKLPIIILLVLGWALGGLTAFTLQSGAATLSPDLQIESPDSMLGSQGEQLAQAEVMISTGNQDAHAGRSAGLVMPGALLLGRGVGRVWR